MLILAPLVVEGGPPGLGRAPVFRGVALLLVVVWLLPRLALAGVAGETGLRLGLALEADLRLSGDPLLFRAWQLWTAALLSDGWSELLLALWVLLVPGAACERVIGSRLGAALLLTLAPAAAAGRLIEGIPVPLVGPGCPALGLLAAAEACLVGARLRWGLGWWLLIRAGWRPLFTSSLVGAGLLLLLLEWLRAAQVEGPGTGWYCSALACVLAGSLVGGVVNRRG